MPKYQLITCLLFIALSLQAQDRGTIPNAGARVFEITDRGDRIEFIKMDTALTQKKPVLLFCQGSLPKPLVATFPNGAAQVLNFNFDAQALTRDYHVITIAMPHTPAVVPNDSLGEGGLWMPDRSKPREFDRDYLQGDHLDNYIRRANAVWKWLRRQSWVDPDRLVVFGHSQGAHVALRMASTNKQVTQLGFCGGNPYGRIDQLIRAYREDEISGKLGAAEAQAKIEELYAWWATMHGPIPAEATEYRAMSETWRSFSQDQTEELLGLKIPVYIVYGTRDITARYCDLLPLEFTRRGKTNFTMKPYPGLEHNFAELDEKGRPIWEKMHWQEVVEGFAMWLKGGKKAGGN